MVELRKRLKTLTRPLADLVWPPSCCACEAEAGRDPRLCRECAEELPRDFGAGCRICGGPLDTKALVGALERCPACWRRRAPWRRLDVVGEYRGSLASLIRALKFGREQAAARNLSELLCASEAGRRRGEGGDAVELILPIPLTPRRLRERGFNQVELIAQGLAELHGAAWRPESIARLREERQNGRSRAERHRLPTATFGARGVFGARVLLVDDVVTTGATLRAATRTLKAAGAREVRCLALARTLRA